jgi:hypothetical protein
MTMLRAILTAVDSPVRAAAGFEYLMMNAYGGSQ